MLLIVSYKIDGRGETRFEIKPEVKKARVTPKEKPVRKRDASSSQPSNVSQHQQQASGQDAGEQALTVPEGGQTDENIGQLLPEVPDLHPLTTALRDRGAAAVDGVSSSRRTTSFWRWSE